MKLSIKTIILCIAFIPIACYDGINETVESSYQLPILPELTYKFSRNGESSVNLQECKLLKSPIDRIFSTYMNNARMGKGNYEEALILFKNGEYGQKPEEEIALSMTHRANREKILNDFQKWFDTSARISGKDAVRPNDIRNTEAQQGVTGFVGRNIGDKDVCFVDEKGFAPAEIFYYAIKGAVYLDKIVNRHLHPNTLNDETIMHGHDITQLEQGYNYTTLEHQWDLAYGYYDILKELAQVEGIPALKGTHEQIFNSFANGRMLMKYSLYNEIYLHADTIREGTARVFAARAINSLIGVNTYANINDNIKYAFRLISQAYGMIYALQFATDKQGNPIMTYEETTSILQKLEQGHGLWDKERLIGDESQEGSLRQIAYLIGKKFGLSLDEFKK